MVHPRVVAVVVTVLLAVQYCGGCGNNGGVPLGCDGRCERDQWCRAGRTEWEDTTTQHRRLRVINDGRRVAAGGHYCGVGPSPHTLPAPVRQMFTRHQTLPNTGETQR